MSMKRCYYECLEVQKGASGDVLKSAYRKMAMRFHPDKNPGDHTAEIKFKEINEAYDVLKDDQKRAAYDRFGHAAFENGMGGRAQSPFGDMAGGFADVFEDIFGQMMGGGRAKRSNRGSDLRYNLEISLEEAFRGRSAEIKVPTQVICEGCSGSGAEAGHQAECGAEHRGADRGEQRDGERIAPAERDAREQVAAQLVGAEEVRGRGLREPLTHRRLVRIEAREHAGEQRDQHHQEQRDGGPQHDAAAEQPRKECTHRFRPSRADRRPHTACRSRS